MSEAKLQSKIIKWLKDQGAYVIKTKPQPGTPVGCPDVVFMFGHKWGVIEVKASATAPFRPGQQATLHHLKSWGPFVYVAHPDNWLIIRDELASQFF